MFAIPAPVAIPTVFMVTNDSVLTITNSYLRRRGDSSRERHSYGGTKNDGFHPSLLCSHWGHRGTRDEEKCFLSI